MREISLPLRSTDITTLASTAWKWWLAELLGMLPTSLLDLLRAHRARVTMKLTSEEIVVSRVRAGSQSELLRFACGDLGNSGRVATARVALYRMVATRQAVDLRLPSSDVLRKTIELPLGATRNLRKILRFELERQSPLEPDHVYFDHHVVRRDKPANKLAVELRIVKREVVNRAVSTCRSLGLEPASIGFIEEERPFKLAGTVAGSQMAARRRSQRWVTLGLAGIGCLLLAAILYVGWVQQRAVASDVAARLVEAKAQAKATDRLREQVKGMASRTEFLARQKANPLLVKVLAEITRTLPDGTWLFQFEMHGSEIRVSGYSPAAPQLVSLFDTSPLFTNTRFRAPLTQGPTTGLERFDLSFEIKGAKR